MKDLTQGSVPGQLLSLAAPICIGMLVQTLYFLVDLYFVGRMGDAALAGVSAAGNVMFIVMALTQMLSVGTSALVARAAGRKDRREVNLVFNQSVTMGLVGAALTLVAGYALTSFYLRTLGADRATLEMGRAYLYCFLPGLALQFAMNAMAAAMRGTGIVKPAMMVQLLTVLLNIVLAPVLIAGWGTGHAFGVAGAGIASSIACAAGVILLARYFGKLDGYLRFERRLMRPQWAVWRRLLNIGFPSGAEFACLFLFMGVIYSVVSQFGAAAMAGFGIGSRLMQAIFLPGMAIAFAVAPLAGQCIGAGAVARVREVIMTALCMETALMAVLTLVCKFQPDSFVRVFAGDAQAASVASEYLLIISWNFIASGIIFVCASLFQALGNTWPSLLSMATRVLTFALPALWLSRQPGFSTAQLWYLSIATVSMQAVMSLLLLRWQWRRFLAGQGSGAGAEALADGSAAPA